MSTRRLIVDIPEESYELLHRSVEEGRYASLDEAISALVADLSLDEMPYMEQEEFERWMLEEVVPAYDEAEAHPESLLTLEQVKEYLAQQREARSKASHAA